MKRIGIVNRGEPAVRFLNTLDALAREETDGPTAVALYTEADSDSVFVRAASHAVCIGAGREAYLDAETVLAGLKAGGCDAAWLGWGFASEDGAFAQVLEEAGIILLAPRAETMRALGDKVEAKRLAEEHDVPVAPWAVVETLEQAREAAVGIGFPLLVKAAGGGGGRGIRRVDAIEDLDEAVNTARGEAARSFGGGAIFLERLVTRARHIEVQMLGDGEGNVVAVGLRDCSLQRRRQKVIEECPAPTLPEERRVDAIEAAVRLCSAVRYRSAGTVEFLYDLDHDVLCFLEVNTRLQVEHPVTEEVFGLDLVRAQIELARGGALPTPAAPRGVAIEARVCAEDVHADFTPAPGRLARFVVPSGPGVRVDTGFVEGDVISPEFDPLIAKVIAWGPDRAVATSRLVRALERTRIVVEGGTTNIAFLCSLLGRDEVRAGDFDTGSIERWTLTAPEGAGVAMIAASIDRFLSRGDRSDGAGRHRVEAVTPFDVHRIGPTTFRVSREDGAVFARYRTEGPYESWLEVGGTRHRIERAPGDVRYVVDGISHRIAAASGGSIVAPSAALVLATPSAEGDAIDEGAAVVILESMKMEVRVEAPHRGVVRRMAVRPGEQVTPGQLLAVVEPADAESLSRPTGAAVPWDADDSAHIADYVHGAFIGWDAPALGLAKRVARLPASTAVELLEVFLDIASLFERRPTRRLGAGDGATDAQDAEVSLTALLERGADALSEAHRARLLRALKHHGIDELDPGEALDDAVLRLRRAGAALGRTRSIAIALLGALTEDPACGELLDRLTALDPGRFGALIEAARRTRGRLVEQPAHQRLLQRAEERAGALLEALRAGEAEWPEVAAAAESLVPSLSPTAAAGCDIAAEAVARRLEWSVDAPGCTVVRVGARPAFVFGEAPDRVACVTAPVSRVRNVLDDIVRAREKLGVLGRLDLVLVPDADTADVAADQQLARILAEVGGAPGWRASCGELCLLMVVPRHSVAVRWLYADGSERLERRNIMPSTARRLDLDRLARFHFRRLPSEPSVVLFDAQAWENPKDRRFLVYAEIRSVERAPGRPVYLPHVDRAFHAAIRAIEAARDRLDPRRRMQWNRITLRIVPPIELRRGLVERYVQRLSHYVDGIGLEKVVVRAPVIPEAGGAPVLTDISIVPHPEGPAVIEIKPASHEPLRPMTPYQVRLAAARRRGLTHPHEVVRLLQIHPDLPPSRFDEYDLDPDGVLHRVSARPTGGNRAAIVFGVIRTTPSADQPTLTRVLLLSDPTQAMGALAEPECRRVMAAIDLAERLDVPLEWVCVSAGARIDYDSGTENLDWTADVLRRIVEFTHRGGQIDVIVPGICVGAQSYWNAEATMMMHTRGILIMTDRGTMVLTGKRALDASGCVSAQDDLALGGYTAIMGPNGQAQAHAADLGDAYRLLYRYHQLTYVPAGAKRPVAALTADPADRDVTASPYPADEPAGGGAFATIGDLFSKLNAERKKPFGIRPLMAAVADADQTPVERWSAMQGAETVVAWETRIGGYSATLIGIENRPIARVDRPEPGAPDVFAGGTLYPQAARKLARALNAASGRRPAVVLANLSGFDGSPESLRRWQLEYGAEIGRAVVHFDGPIIFVVVSRYHGGAYVVFSKRLNPRLTVLALEGSFASVIGGAPAATVVLSRDVQRRAQELGGGGQAMAQATSEIAARFDSIHSVERARSVGSVDAIIAPSRLRPEIVARLSRDYLQTRPTRSAPTATRGTE